MGGSSWSENFYDARAKSLRDSGRSAFDYSDRITRGDAHAECHDMMNPFEVTRESRDSDAHPESLAIGVMFDETGSMGDIPITLQKKLTKLMGLLIRKGYVEHPQMLFGAIGDFTTPEVASLQVGQFESGIEMDEDLGRIYLEGLGGGSRQESYQNAIYFFARHTVIDCHEKRGQKGYLFLIGDEMPYDFVNTTEVKTLIGDTLQDDIPVAEIISEARERYHIFFVIPRGASHGTESTIARRWISLLGQEYVIQLEDPNAVCETIAIQIGLHEDMLASLEEGIDDLKDAGVDAHTAASVSTALSKYAASRPSSGSVVKVDMEELPDISRDEGSKEKRTKRL